MKTNDRKTFFLGSRAGILLAALPLALALGMSACATTGSVSQTEDLLSQAGFKKVAADTPQKVGHMQTLPDHRLVARTYKGNKYYVYSDPDGCKCIYVGNPTQYQSYRNSQQQQTAQGGVEESREWEEENPGKYEFE